MAVRPLNIISLCTGGGGLDRAVELAVPSARPVLCVEREAFAVANLVAQMQQRVMAAAPVWSDARTVPGRRFRGLVDGVIGGIPCQPYSLAGKRLGRNDERDLWGSARRIFVQSGAWFILIENVGGMLSEGGAERVRGDLQRLGCEVEGGLFRASEVGANHERERLFILGVLDARLGVGQADPKGQRGGAGLRQGGQVGDWDGVAGGGRDLVHAAGIGRGEGRPEPELRRGRRSAGVADRPVADADLAVLCREPPAGELAILQRDDGTGAAPVGVGQANADSQRLQGLGPYTSPQGREDARGPAGLRDRAGLDDAPGGDGRLYARPRPEVSGAPDPRRASEMVDAIGGDLDGWPDEPEWSAERRAAVEWASRGPLFAPGPGDVDAWSAIAEHAPERLPALSRHDMFLVEIRKARASAYGLAPPGYCKAWGGSSPETWMDEGGPYGLRPAVVQAIAQSTLRRGSDGLAPRIDQLRMLGNGVVDLEGAYAVRTLATDLAARSAGAAELVRLMGEQP